MSLRSAWCTYGGLGQPRLHTKTFSQKKGNVQCAQVHQVAQSHATSSCSKAEECLNPCLATLKATPPHTR